jgi:hypothetical protein
MPGERQTYTHTQQADQTAIQPPAPEPIDFESNPDAIALRSAISILQMQRQRAAADMQTLSKAKDEAVQDPEGYVNHLVARSASSSVGGDGQHGGQEGGSGEDEQHDRQWTQLPKPQDVVRCPPINWSQYAIVGESLDKLHAEQVSQPTQGTPAVVGQGGMYEFKGGDGKQERYTGPAAPYNPVKDKIDRRSKTKR